MVIGFDASRAFSKDRTGTENYSYQLLLHLSKMDHKNKYIVYLRPGVVASLFPPNFRFETINLPRLWTQVGLGFQTFKDQLDLLFVPAHTLPNIRRPGLKTVVTVHDLGSEYLPKLHQYKQRIYLSYMQRMQLKGASKIIAVSEATKKDLMGRLGIKPDQIRVIYEGYDREKFKVQNSKFKVDRVINILKRYDLVSGGYFLFVGTIQPRKNLERLIQAFYNYYNYYKDYTLVLAGAKGWLSGEIYKLPKKLGVEDRVKFLGYVPDENLPPLYSGAIALTLPSLFEGFGIPLLEAQSCGCPVITSNISSMPEVAGKGAILVDPYNVNDIVGGMERVKREGERKRLIKAGFENIKRFSWEKCARETLEVLKEAAAKL